MSHTLGMMVVMRFWLNVGRCSALFVRCGELRGKLMGFFLIRFCNCSILNVPPRVITCKNQVVVTMTRRKEKMKSRFSSGEAASMS